MKNINTAMIGLKDCLVNHLSEYIQENNNFEVAIPEISEKQIIIDFPDIDKLPFSVTVYIVPDYSSQSNQTTCHILNSDTVKVWIFAKRDKQENLIAKSSCVYSAILQTLLNHRTLDGKINVLDFESADFYPSVTASNTVAAYEITLSLKYVLSV